MVDGLHLTPKSLTQPRAAFLQIRVVVVFHLSKNQSLALYTELTPESNPIKHSNLEVDVCQVVVARHKAEYAPFRILSYPLLREVAMMKLAI